MNTQTGQIGADVNVTAFDTLTPRIIQFQGKRSCIRLEDVYWNILEDAARDKKLKFNELVHSFYHDPRGERNKTAFLRCQAVEWLSGQVETANEQLHLKNSELHSILKVTVQPAFVFSNCKVYLATIRDSKIGLKSMSVRGRLLLIKVNSGLALGALTRL